MSSDDDTQVTVKFKDRTVTTDLTTFEKARKVAGDIVAINRLTRDAVKEALMPDATRTAEGPKEDPKGLQRTGTGLWWIKTPDAMLVRLVCPECGIEQTVEVEMAAQLTIVDELDGGKIAKLAPKMKAQKVAHMCQQLTVDSAEAADLEGL